MDSCFVGIKSLQAATRTTTDCVLDFVTCLAALVAVHCGPAKSLCLDADGSKKQFTTKTRTVCLSGWLATLYVLTWKNKLRLADLLDSHKCLSVLFVQPPPPVEAV